ncbi:MAG: ribosome-associated translation inhibitor RaiA [Treponema sp.]|jgi:putative sigma-54 modulation protein|nr:ribosome-associated translation inhibitor RaiA [Treponema sp.]
MNVDIKAVHFSLEEKSRSYLEHKIGRIHNAENMLVDLLFTITKDNAYQAEATVNFRWGVTAHVKESDFDLRTALDKLLDTLEAKITKEKEKEKEKR